MATKKDIPQLAELISSQVLTLRSQRVLLAQQLSLLYGVETRVLNQAVQRNIDRFPDDFMFRLEAEDMASLRSQTVTLNTQDIDSKENLNVSTLAKSRGAHTKYTPYAFTEQGIAMLSSVLKSPQAVAVNIQIMRAFVNMRSMASEHQEIKRQILKMESKYDKNFKVVFDALHRLMDAPPANKHYQSSKIGFTKDDS